MHNIDLIENIYSNTLNLTKKGAHNYIIINMLISHEEVCDMLKIIRFNLNI